MADLPHRLKHEEKFAKQIAEILARHREEWEQDRTVETERELDEVMFAFLALIFSFGAHSAAKELGIGLVVRGGAESWADINATTMARRTVTGIGRRLQRARLADMQADPRTGALVLDEFGVPIVRPRNLNTIFNQTVESILLPKTWNNFAATEVTRAYTAGGEYTAAVYNIGRLMPDRSGALFTGGPTVSLPKPGDGLVPPAPGEPLQLPEPALAIWSTEKDRRVCPVCKPLDGEPREVWSGSFPLGPPAHEQCRCYLSYSTGEE